MVQVHIKTVGIELEFPRIEKGTEKPVKELEKFEADLRKIVTDNKDKVVVRIYQNGDHLGRIASALSNTDISLKKENDYYSDKWGEKKVVFLGTFARIRTSEAKDIAKTHQSEGKWKDTYLKVSVLTAHKLLPHDHIFSLGDTIYIAGADSDGVARLAVAECIKKNLTVVWG